MQAVRLDLCKCVSVRQSRPRRRSGSCSQRKPDAWTLALPWWYSALTPTLTLIAHLILHLARATCPCNLPLPLGFDHSDDYIGADTGPFPLNPLCSSGYHLRGSSWAWCPWNRGQTWRRTRCSYSAHVPTLEVWMLIGWRHSYGTGGTKGPTTWQVRARGLHCECRYRYGVLPSSVPRPCQQTVEMPAHRQVCIHIRIYIYTTMLIRARKYTHHARRNMSYPLASNNSYHTNALVHAPVSWHWTLCTSDRGFCLGNLVTPATGQCTVGENNRK